MENKDYERILNTMPEIGVYVIREEDRTLLYFNKRVQEVSPEARVGTPCFEIWSRSCNCCPLLAMGSKTKKRTVSYNDTYGGAVDITAARTLWEGHIPAFVVTVVPRVDTAGYTYRKILHVDLEQDLCDVLKSDPDGWQPGPGSLSRQLEDFARSGAIHPEDEDRFVSFTRLEHLRAAFQSGKETLTLIYRRLVANTFRWNLMEVFAVADDEVRYAVLCVKDVHSALRKGLELEGVSARSQELIRSLGERNFDIYTIDLRTGSTDSIRVDGQMQEGAAPQPWGELMCRHILDRLHEGYQDEFERKFSLEGLCQARDSGLQKTDLLCQWRSGQDYRYISVTAYFSQKPKARNYAILALQDVDERMRQELAHTQRDMQMATILRSRFRQMTTVYLDSGQCECTDLTQTLEPENPLLFDYASYLQNQLSSNVLSDDTANVWDILSLEHLREKATSVEDYAEEVCQYRTQETQTRWIELRVIYSRLRDRVMVNILSQDITREKFQESAKLQALEERAQIISSLSSLFFSTYYIDLEHDSFRPVIQLRRVVDVLGDEMNCTAALQLYANHFIHPDDRAKYLETMSMENLRANLRWWQPCVAMEYRKLPDSPFDTSEPCSWVRATAVLARTGPDDMPKTAVYVAQNLTDNTHRSQTAENRIS